MADNIPDTNEPIQSSNIDYTLESYKKAQEQNRIKYPHLYNKPPEITTTELRGLKFTSPDAIIEELVRAEHSLKKYLPEGVDVDTKDPKILGNTILVPDPKNPSQSIERPVGAFQDDILVYRKFLEQQIQEGKLTHQGLETKLSAARREQGIPEPQKTTESKKPGGIGGMLSSFKKPK